MALAISCRLSAAVAGNCRRMGRAKRAVAEPSRRRKQPTTTPCCRCSRRAFACNPTDSLVAGERQHAAASHLCCATPAAPGTGSTSAGNSPAGPDGEARRGDRGGAGRRRPQQRHRRRRQAALSRPSRPGAGAGAEGRASSHCADYELLELLLFYAIERIDTKPLAKRLIERFGTLGDIFAAEPAQLREFEIDQRTLVLFRAVARIRAAGWPSARSRTCRC